MNVESVANLVRVLSGSSQLTEIEVRQGDVVLRLRRPAPAAPAKVSKPTAPKAAPPSARTAFASVPAGTNATVVAAEFVGVFHSPPPSLPVVGSTIAAKQSLGQIETMRLMNGVPAPIAGRLQAVLVQDGQPVEYGQPLFEIVPEEAN